MCIDIFAPNQCIDITFLQEQIWISVDPTHQDHLQVTEVYDICLRNVEHNYTLKEVCVLFPHNFTQKQDNSRTINAKTEPFGGRDYSKFDWAYRGELSVDNQSETVHRLLSSLAGDSPDKDIVARDLSARLDFCDGLSDDSLDLLSQAEATMLKVSFDDLEPGESGWFRLVMKQPLVESTIRRKKHIPGVSFPFCIQEYRTISSPQVVRERVNYRLSKLCMNLSSSHQEAFSESTRPIKQPNMATRIHDHRVAILFDDPLDIENMTPTGNIQRCGVFQILDGTVGVLWAGGSELNTNNDLIENAKRILQIIDSNYCTNKNSLIHQFAPPGKVESLNALLNSIIDIGLVDDDNGKLSAINDWESDIDLFVHSRLSKSLEKSDVALMNQFTDLHPFKIDYCVKWFSQRDKTNNILRRCFKRLKHIGKEKSTLG